MLKSVKMPTFQFDNMIFAQISSRHTFKSRKRDLFSGRPRMFPFNNITVLRVWNNGPLCSTSKEYANCGMSDKRSQPGKRRKRPTCLNGDRTPTAMTMFKDVVSELIVFFR